MAEQNDSTQTPPARGGGTGAGPSGSGAPSGSSASSGSGGGRPGGSRSRSRGRSRGRGRSGAGSGGQAPAGAAGAPGVGSAGRGQTGRSGGGSQKGGGQKPGGQAQGRGSQGPGRPPGAPRDRAPSRPPSSTGAPAPAVVAPSPEVKPSLGAPLVLPTEVAASRRRVVTLCAYTALIPALLLGILCLVAVSVVVGIVAFLAFWALAMYGLWRLAPSVALGRIGATPVDEHDDPRLANITEGLCATFGLHMPTLHVLDDDVPNACVLGRDARRSDLVVTSGLLRRLDPIELEGVIAHELAHVKRGDNGVSCVGVTLATLFGGERTLRRCVGENREYRADVVGASAVRYPSGLLSALEAMTEAAPPAADSFFASPSRFGPTRWVWIDPFVGRRDEIPLPGDLDATSVRVAALGEW